MILGTIMAVYDRMPYKTEDSIVNAAGSAWAKSKKQKRGNFWTDSWRIRRSCFEDNEESPLNLRKMLVQATTSGQHARRKVSTLLVGKLQATCAPTGSYVVSVRPQKSLAIRNSSLLTINIKRMFGSAGVSET